MIWLPIFPLVAFIIRDGRASEIQNTKQKILKSIYKINLSPGELSFKKKKSPVSSNIYEFNSSGLQKLGPRI